MKLKYYLRGLGVGIIVTTIILAISFGGKQTDIDDIPTEEIIAKATMLGMVMPEEQDDAATEQQESSGEDFSNQDTEKQDAEVSDMPNGGVETETSGEPENVGNSENTDVPENAGEGAGAEKQVADPNAGETKEPYRLVVNRGDVCRTVCENLAANGVIDDAEVFRKYLSEIGYASSISVGNYDIPYGLTQEEIANILKNGPIEEQQ